MRENALELHGVCKKYGGFALRNVGFTLPRGTVMGLILCLWCAFVQLRIAKVKGLPR